MDREALFVDNFGLVGMVLKRLGIYPDDSMYEDYQQIGYIGLYKASQKFKPELGFRFSTYAVPMIIGEIKRERQETAHFLKIPRKTKEAYYRYRGLGKRGLDDLEVCKKLGITMTELTEIKKPFASVAHLDAPIRNESDGNVILLGDSLPSETNLEDECISKVYWEGMFGNLTEVERKCVELRTAGMVQREIAKRVGLSQAQVSRVLIKAKTKLSNMLGGAA